MFIIRLFWCAFWGFVTYVAYMGGAPLVSLFAGMMVVFGMMAGDSK
jgi:hypothetical protein